MKNIKVMMLFSILILSLVTCIDSASAEYAEYHVSIYGHDGAGHDGSQSDPWHSIQYAIDRGEVSDGDTIHVHAGLYEVADAIRINKKISLIGDGQSTTFIDGGTTYDALGNVQSKGCRGIMTSGLDSSSAICGFTIQNGYAEFLEGLSNLDSHSFRLS